MYLSCSFEDLNNLKHHSHGLVGWSLTSLFSTHTAISETNHSHEAVRTGVSMNVVIDFNERSMNGPGPLLYIAYDWQVS